MRCIDVLINKKVKLLSLTIIWIVLILLIPISGQAEAATKSNTYTVKSTSQPYRNRYKTYSTYNDNTRHYYVLRSYLEQLEKVGGGTLVISKGTYVITNTLFVPSNVTILLKDGAKLIKGNKTGTTKLSPSKAMFQLVAPSKSGNKAFVESYAGETGITLRGEGDASIDLNYTKDTVGIVVGHNRDITIEGITFQKMYGGNMIKIGASKEVVITDNIFRSHKNSVTGSREAIAIEVPDSQTKSFSYSWSKNDNTVSSNITIENNEFFQLERAIGSSKYTENKYHKNIKLIGNTFSETDSHTVRILNWDKGTLINNKFTNIRNREGNLKAVLISGAINPTISENEFFQTDRAIQIMPWKNNKNGSSYEITYNKISADDKAAMVKNTLKDMGEYIIRYNKTYNEFTKNTEKWEIYDSEINSFTITSTAEPFQNYFTNYSTYNSKTKQYYVLRSYLEQLERLGGGSLTLEAGTYQICNTLYVPSNVTIRLKDGVTIRKTEQTGIEDFDSSKSIFQLAAPSKSKVEGAYSGYEGESAIRFLGEGSATIDLNFIQDSIGIVLGHNREVMISGITFKNMYSGHFIEVDASTKVTIEKNKFLHHRSSGTGVKEAINLDTPDKNTGGFNAIWTSYDKTPNKDILIKENTFKDLERAIGTHKYSEGSYHTNIQIINNKITDTDSDAIRIINWKSPLIKENEITRVADGTGNDRAILASGLIDPVITENTFTEVPRAIQLMPWKNNGEGSQYAITYNEISQENINLMLKNYLVRVGETFIRINKTYNEFTYDTNKYYYSYEYLR